MKLIGIFISNYTDSKDYKEKFKKYLLILNELKIKLLNEETALKIHELVYKSFPMFEKNNKKLEFEVLESTIQ